MISHGGIQPGKLKIRAIEKIKKSAQSKYFLNFFQTYFLQKVLMCKQLLKLNFFFLVYELWPPPAPRPPPLYQKCTQIFFLTILDNKINLTHKIFFIMGIFLVYKLWTPPRPPLVARETKDKSD